LNAIPLPRSWPPFLPDREQSALAEGPFFGTPFHSARFRCGHAARHLKHWWVTTPYPRLRCLVIPRPPLPEHRQRLLLTAARNVVAYPCRHSPREDRPHDRSFRSIDPGGHRHRAGARLERFGCVQRTDGNIGGRPAGDQSFAAQYFSAASKCRQGCASGRRRPLKRASEPARSAAGRPNSRRWRP